jgi:hypothetical protein
MRIFATHKGIEIYTSLAGGFYFRAGILIAFLTVGEAYSAIDRLF